MHVFHLKDLATPTHPEIALTLQRWRRANNSGEHRHDGVEIVFVLSGSGVNFLDGRPFPIIAGDLYVVNRGAVHSFYSNNELIFYNLLFSFSLFSRREQEEFRRIPEFERVFAAALTRGAGFDKLSLPPAAAERLRELFEALNRELRTAAPGSRLGVRATLMLLIVEICRCAAAPPSPLAAAKDNHHSPLTRIIDFLNANFRRPLDLSELAEAAGLSPTYVGEFFRNRTGIPLVRRLTTLRIDEARRLLARRPEWNITEIAARCGFEDSGYFTRVFRAATGETPTQYRKKIREKL